ncbi:MAG: FAD-dependent oxidoreductase [Candidatus Thermoplasmatota archaeon]|nr:FAD-dependent oxidoreductase [Candidatus Thermoplasmatota archaeon]
MSEKPVFPRIEKFQLEVVENIHHTPWVWLPRFERTDGKPLDFLAGQWVLTRVEKNGEDIRRAYSVASPPHIKDYFELCVKRVEGGAMSPILCGLEEGDIIDGAGPYGKVILVNPVQTGFYYVATGTGIAPFRSMIDTMYQEGQDVPIHLYFGVRKEEDLIYHDHWRRLGREHPKFEYIPTLSRPINGWKGERGYVQRLVEERVSSWNDEEVYICGIPEMVDEVREMFMDMGAPKDRTHVEKWY